MNSDFTPVKLAEKERYYELWAQTPRRSLDYTLANLWGWRDYYGLEWRFADGLCWIRQMQPKPAYWAPLGNWQAADWEKIFAQGLPHEMIRVPEELARLWERVVPGRAQVAEERGQWEYLYNQEELATLPGKRFHKKRTHLNNYVKSYGEPDYRPISDAMAEDVLGLQDEWCQWHECEGSPSLQAENEAINRVLSHWDQFRGLTGGSLYVDNKIVAFSVGEDLDGESLGVHYEKGLGGIKGVYQTINSCFSGKAGQGFKWINRAQDLDEEGLRQAKLTYNPADFLKKYRVIVR